MMKKFIFSLLVYHSSLFLSVYNPQGNTITVNGIFENDDIKKGLKDRNTFMARWRKFGEPSLFSVPIVCWLTSRYLASKGMRPRVMEKIKQYSVTGMQAHLFYRVSKTCYDFYQAVVQHQTQEYTIHSVKHNFLTDLISSMFYVSKSILESRIFGNVLTAYLNHQSKENNTCNIDIYLNRGITQQIDNKKSSKKTNTLKNSSCLKEHESEEESELKKKEQAKKDNPLAFVGLLCVPVVVTAGLLWALVYNQPFFKECKDLERLLKDDNKKEAVALIKEYFKDIHEYNLFESNPYEKANKKAKKNEAIEVLLYNKRLIENNIHSLDPLLRDTAVKLAENPYEVKQSQYSENYPDLE